LKRVAIVDFDVHHGNGTEHIFHDEPRVMLCSTFQHPFYPYVGTNSGNDHIINVPLSAGTDGAAFRAAVTNTGYPHWSAFNRNC
jgi:acetoin utilization deacetylase AcuC-like enzyme